MTGDANSFSAIDMSSVAGSVDVVKIKSRIDGRDFATIAGLEKTTMPAMASLCGDQYLDQEYRQGINELRNPAVPVICECLLLPSC